MRYAVVSICVLLVLLLPFRASYAVENPVLPAHLSTASVARGVLLIVADDASYDTEKRKFSCNGSVMVKIGGQDARLEADKATFDLDAAMLDARDNVRIWRCDQLTTGSSYKFKIMSDEYLITSNDGFIKRLEVVTRTAGSAPQNTVCRIDSRAYTVPDSDRLFLTDKNAYLVRLYGGPVPIFRMPARLRQFGQEANGKTWLFGVDDDRYGIKAYLGDVNIPDLTIAKWLRVGGGYSDDASSVVRKYARAENSPPDLQTYIVLERLKKANGMVLDILQDLQPHFTRGSFPPQPNAVDLLRNEYKWGLNK